MTPIISVVGWHNSGKTTLLAALVVVLKGRGLRVAAVKHTGGRFDMDHEGTDTWHFARAGSDVVAISGGGRLAMLEQGTGDLPLADVVARLPSGLDLVLTEGFKRAATPKIEVRRAEVGGRAIASPEQLIAVVTDEAEPPVPAHIPRYAHGQAEEIVQMLIAKGYVALSEAS